MFSVNALVWLLIPIAVTCFAAWLIAQRAQAAERDDPNELSPAELEKMQRALDKTTPKYGDQGSVR